MPEQQYYTSSPRLKDGNAGFGIKAESSGMDTGDGRVLAQEAARYARPYDVSETDLGAMPLAFSFWGVRESHWGLCRAVGQGRDYSDRPGNYFAHSVLLTETDLAPLGGAPIMLFDATFWCENESDGRYEDAEQIRLPVLPLPLVAPLAWDEAMDDFFKQEPTRRRKEYLARVLEAVFSEPQTHRRVVLVDDAHRGARHWIQAVSVALPPRLRSSFSFSTYQRSPYEVAYTLTGTTRSGDFRFSSNEYQFEFAVFHFEDGYFSENIVPGGAAELLANALLDGNTELVLRFHQMADALRLADRTLLNDVADVLYTTQKEKNATETETTSAVDALRRLWNKNKESAAFACQIAYALCADSLDSGNFNKVRTVTPLYHELVASLQSTPTTGRMQSLFAEFLRDNFRTERGLEILEMFGGLMKDSPLLLPVIAENLGALDWAELLQANQPVRAKLEKLLPALQSSAAEGKENSSRLWHQLFNLSLPAQRPHEAYPAVLQLLTSIFKQKQQDHAFRGIDLFMPIVEEGCQRAAASLSRASSIPIAEASADAALAYFHLVIAGIVHDPNLMNVVGAAQRNTRQTLQDTGLTMARQADFLQATANYPVLFEQTVRDLVHKPEEVYQVAQTVAGLSLPLQAQASLRRVDALYPALWHNADQPQKVIALFEKEWKASQDKKGQQLVAEHAVRALLRTASHASHYTDLLQKIGPTLTESRSGSDKQRLWHLAYLLRWCNQPIQAVRNDADATRLREASRSVSDEETPDYVHAILCLSDLPQTNSGHEQDIKRCLPVATVMLRMRPQVYAPFAREVLRFAASWYGNGSVYHKALAVTPPLLPNEKSLPVFLDILAEVLRDADKDMRAEKEQKEHLIIFLIACLRGVATAFGCRDASVHAVAQFIKQQPSERARQVSERLGHMAEPSIIRWAAAVQEQNQTGLGRIMQNVWPFAKR